MSQLRHPSTRIGSFLLMLLKVYLISFLVGCASTRPLPADEARELQTRAFDTDYETLFEAAKSGLQDLNYTVKTIDYDAGTIVAARNTDRMLGEIATESEGPPTWAKVLLIATGIVLVIALIAVLADGDDDDEDDDEEVRHDEVTHVTNIYDMGDDNFGGDFFHYDVTLNLRSLSERSTELRVNVEGSRIEGGKVSKAGLVHDPPFYYEFFDVMARAVDRIESESR